MDDKIITIAIHNYARAQVLQGHLNSEGIECYLKNVNLLLSSISGGVKVQVHEDDLEHALRIVEKVNDEYRKEQEDSGYPPKKVQRILVPVDFSMYSKNACYYALGLAEKLNAEVKLMHVYYNPVVNSMPMTDTYYYQVNLDEIIRDIELRAKEQMEAFYNEIKQYVETRDIQNIKLDYALVRGITHEEILEKSEQYHPDVIITGYRGKGEKPGDIIGGVTQRIMEKATVPVLAVPEKAEYQGIGNINIMYVTDFDDSDYVAIEKLMNIVNPFNVRLNCVHISSHDTNKWDKVKMESFREHITEIYPNQTFNCDLIEQEDELKGIQDFVQEKHIDIISLVTHKRNIISKLLNPSIAKKLLFHTNIPLLVFHAND